MAESASSGPHGSGFLTQPRFSPGTWGQSLDVFVPTFSASCASYL